MNRMVKGDVVSRNIVNRVIQKIVTAGFSVTNLFTGLLAAALILYSGYSLYDSLYIENQAYSNWDVIQYKPEIIDDANIPLTESQLASINSDYRAWLTLYDTNINYPVMQGTDNVFYASHDIYKKTNITGAIYLAAENSRDLSTNYNLIYGHHMDNEAMFGGLDRYREEDYAENHRTGVIVTGNAVYDLDVFAVMETTAYESNIYTYNDSKDVQQFIQFLRNHINGYGKNSTIWFDTLVANTAEKIVVLSTCASAETNGRLIIVAKMTPRDLTKHDPTSEITVSIPDPSPSPSPTPTPTPSPSTEEFEDADTPLSSWLNGLHPGGSGYGHRAWALLNLICTICTAYLFLPFNHLKAKFGRCKKMTNANELELEYSALELTDPEEANEPIKDEEVQTLKEAYQELFEDEGKYQNEQFKTRIDVAFVAELLLTIAAIVIFILTEDMRLPMVIIDRWTLLHVVILFITWYLDVRLARYRPKEEEWEYLVEEDEDDNEHPDGLDDAVQT